MHRSVNTINEDPWDRGYRRHPDQERLDTKCSACKCMSSPTGLENRFGGRMSGNGRGGVSDRYTPPCVNLSESERQEAEDSQRSVRSEHENMRTQRMTQEPVKMPFGETHNGTFVDESKFGVGCR